MALLVRAGDVPESKVPMKLKAGALSTKQVFGRDASIMIARRSAGYHSRPHVHNCEQLNYVMEGEIWIFTNGDRFHLREGDFNRVPKMAVHWAWNRSDRDCVLFECHAPGLDMLPRDQTVDLLEADESPRDIERVPNIWASDDYLEAERE
jgi:quercetin dioxygenase-like cupin family protein